MFRSLVKLLMSGAALIAIFYGATFLFSAMTTSLAEVPYQFRGGNPELTNSAAAQP